MVEFIPTDLMRIFRRGSPMRERAGSWQNTKFEISARSWTPTTIAGLKLPVLLASASASLELLQLGNERLSRSYTTHKDYRLSFDGQVAMFNVRPADCKQLHHIRELSRGPVYGLQMERLDKSIGIFGRDGFPNFRSARYIVAYKPRVKVTFSVLNTTIFMSARAALPDSSSVLSS